MTYRPITPYSHHTCPSDGVCMSVKVGRHGTLKAIFEFGVDLLNTVGWHQSQTTVDLFVDTDTDTVRFEKGTSYLVRKSKSKKYGTVVVPATPLGRYNPERRRKVQHSIDTRNRIYVVYCGDE